MDDSDPALTPSNVELGLDGRFSHGIVDWMLSNRLTARELAMLAFMDDITERENWHELVFDKDTVRAWRLEAAKNLLISQKTWDWCLAELRFKAREFRRTGTVFALDTGSRVSKTYPLLKDETVRILKEAAATMAGHTDPDVLFPAVRNLVHPSYYPLVYGRTEIVSEDKPVPLHDLWAGSDRRPRMRTLLKPHALVAMVEEDAQAWYEYTSCLCVRQNPLSEPLEVYGGHDVLDYLPGEYGAFQGRPGYLQDAEERWAAEKPWRYSNRLQWLPCDVQFKEPGGTSCDVRIASYISNLHPDEFPSVYGALEDIISAAIPQWSDVVIRIVPDEGNAHPHWKVSQGRTPHRINLFGLLRAPDPQVPWCERREGNFWNDLGELSVRWRVTDDTERQSDLEEILSRMRQAPLADRPWSVAGHEMPICLAMRNFVHPEPGTLFSVDDWVAGRNVGRVIVPKRRYFDEEFDEHWAEPPPTDEEGYYVDGPRNFVDRPVALQVEYRERGLQVYVKVQSIELTPEDPVVCEGEWAVEGTFNEHVVALSIYIFDVENVRDDTIRLAFRQPVMFPANGSFGGRMYPEVASLFAWDHKYRGSTSIDPYQAMGTVAAREGRLLTFPATMLYRLEPLELADPSRPGHVRFVTLCLSDPNYRVVSTGRVPPTRRDWWLRDVFPAAFLAGKGLPAEIRDRIAELAFEPEGHLLNEEEAREYRVWTAWERTRIMAELQSGYWAHDWHLTDFGSGSEDDDSVGWSGGRR